MLWESVLAWIFFFLHCFNKEKGEVLLRYSQVEVEVQFLLLAFINPQGG